MHMLIVMLYHLLHKWAYLPPVALNLTAMEVGWYIGGDSSKYMYIYAKVTNVFILLRYGLLTMPFGIDDPIQ